MVHIRVLTAEAFIGYRSNETCSTALMVQPSRSPQARHAPRHYGCAGPTASVPASTQMQVGSLMGRSG